jgi:hypothetical protein
LDQAQAQSLVGTYAKEMNTAEGVMRTLSQQTKSLTQTFGSLFLPILVTVIPYVQAFVEVLTDAVHGLAALFGIELQKVDWSGYGDDIGGVAGSAEDATNALGSAAKAAKELKNATLGIDELNVISPPSKSGGSGSSTGGGAGFDGLDVDSLWDESIFDSVQSKVAELKEDVKNALLDLAPIAAGLALALAGLKLTNLLDDIALAGFKLGNLGRVISVAGISLAVGKLVWDFTGAYLEDGNWASFFGALGTTAIGAGLAYKFAGKGGLGFTLMVSGVAMLGRLALELKEGTVDFGDPETWITMLAGGIETVIGGVFTWKVLGPIIKKAVAKLGSGGLFGALFGAAGGSEAAKSALTFMAPKLSETLAKIVPALSTALSNAWGAISSALAAIPVWGWIAAAVLALIGGAIGFGAADYDFSEMGRKVGKAIGDAFVKFIKGVDAVTDWVVDVGKAIKDGFAAAIAWVAENFSSPEAIAKLLGNIVEAVKEGFSDFVEAGKHLIDGLWQGVEDWWTNFKSNIKEFCDGFLKGFLEAFGIHSPATTMIPVGENIVAGLWSGITGAFDWIVGKVSGWATDLIGKITGAMKPSAISEKLSSMWTTAKNWWNNSKAALKTYTPSIGSIKDKVSSAWSTAKSWWDKTKSKLATYTPSIGSIKDKVSSAWTTAKNWWNRSKGSMSYTPSIGSIKNALSSAWNTAKTWWNRNVKLSIPSLAFKVTYSNNGLNFAQKGIVKALGLSGWPKLSFAANGGIFDQGSLVWAGERGAEIVANAGGGKTGVMNVQQMQDAVYEGVYAAVVAAMRADGGGGQAVNVYLDGRQITASVEQRQRERGASIMGNQVYSYG